MPEPVTIREEPTTAVDPNATQEQQITQEDNVEIQGEEKLLAGKYKSQDELEKAYLELQRKQSQPPEQREEVSESQPQTAKEIYGDFVGSKLEESGVDYNNMNERWQKNGKLEDADYEQLQGAGFTREMVESYLDGLQYRATKDNQLSVQQATDLQNEYGGAERYRQMTEWAAQNFTETERAAYDKAMKSTDIDYVRLAVDGLQARYMAATDQEPRLIGGRSSRGSSNDVFESNAQLVEAMNDPRYSRDSAYRKKVADKLGRSNIL